MTRLSGSVYNVVAVLISKRRRSKDQRLDFVRRKTGLGNIVGRAGEGDEGLRVVGLSSGIWSMIRSRADCDSGLRLRLQRQAKEGQAIIIWLIYFNVDVLAIIEHTWDVDSMQVVLIERCSGGFQTVLSYLSFPSHLHVAARPPLPQSQIPMMTTFAILGQLTFCKKRPMRFSAARFIEFLLRVFQPPVIPA